MLSRRPEAVAKDAIPAFENEPISQEYDIVLRELLRTHLVAGEPCLRRLEESRKPICETATDLGYAQIGAFRKSFRRRTGVSPSAYRKANRRGSL